MHKLPPLRQLKKLSELGTFIRGVSYKKPELLPRYQEGCVTLLRANNIQKNSLDLSQVQYLPNKYTKAIQLIQKDDILFCMSSGSSHLVGKNVKLPKLNNFSFGTFCSVLRISHKDCDVNYLSYCINENSYFEYITNIARGAGINNLRNNDLEEFEIPLPPLATQLTIVERLDEISKTIQLSKQKIQSQIKNLESLWGSNLSKIFDNNEYPIKKLGDKEVFTLIMGQSPDSKTYNKKGIGLPFFQGKKEFGKISPFVAQRCSNPIRIAEPGDILLSVRAPVGPTNIANQKCCIGRGLSAIRINKAIGDNEYIGYFFKKFQVEISNLGKGSTFDAITKADLEQITISLPPLAIQQKIVKELNNLNHIITSLKHKCENQLKEHEYLWASTLDKLLKKNS